MHGMMLQDRISRGMGVAARRIGTVHEMFRPVSSTAPLARDNRRLRLHASFSAEDARFGKPAGYGRATWWGVFDAAYTQPGDYLVGAEGSYFVAAQQPLLPVLCVQANRTVSVGRPGAAVTGVGGYGGVQPGAATTLLRDWPASILGVVAGSAGVMPGDGGVGTVTVLLPRLPVQLRTGDLVVDDLDRTFVAGVVEESGLGWRLAVRAASS